MVVVFFRLAPSEGRKVGGSQREGEGVRVKGITACGFRWGMWGEGAWREVGGLFGGQEGGGRPLLVPGIHGVQVACVLACV